MRIAIVLTTFSVVFLTACTTLSEEEQYALENKRILAEERYYQAEAACQRMGGVMELSAKRWGQRSHREYAAAKCVKY